MTSNKFRRLFPTVLVTIALLGTACGTAATESTVAETGITIAGAAPEHQDPGHARLDQLVGEWNVEKATFVAGGTPDNPLRGHDLVSRWRWIGKTGNNFLEEEVEGMLGDRPYYRLGHLGYSTVDDRYEWSTVDSVSPMMMTYQGAKGSGSAAEISMTGDFTDPGLTGEQNIGMTIPMRTLIKLESLDRTVMEIYFTPPGEPELLADRVVLTRRR
ncbi:DUF1579 family protein [Nocardia donostiensis]|uniref:DUF1579 domain-containing protein n=1 Tax=Nocardia donostiensis TaxID=1538463 RepID=A0A1V2THC2_9NOCA|nr:DUF1579 family protein [Nocardia donostiensis]ONM48843.1 hypothetical protein B0T46_10185 [Nocardia donostiensis]OQS22902.1 hypothetical protein B0T44_04280 [Nocardia donostiensis]